MKKLSIYIFLTLSFLSAKSQQNEYYFRFVEANKSIINSTLTNIISIDRVKHDTICAYANESEFKTFSQLGYKYTLLPKPSLANTKTLTMATTVAQMATWDKYPTYSVYRAMMKKYESDYPSLCKLDSIGTTPNGHKLYVVKLSKNVSIDEPEVEVFYTSTIHGDETTGFVLMLRLMDYFLSNYGIDARTTSMMNSMAIYINPDANPDGTYEGGDNTVSGAIRYNANYVDINRNFPDPRVGDHPNGAWQPETQAMMNFAYSRHFILSANFHGGSEVVNYPWDSWISSVKTHPDNNWFVHVSRQYADSAHANSPAGYLTDENNGITEGGDWYVISGGRQDYMNWWHHCREVTIELSNTKLLSTDQLPNWWNYNKASLINYLESATKGFNGIVTSSTGTPIKAKVFITGHDTDSSQVYSSPTTGFYTRPIEPGTWQVTYSASGYISQTYSINIPDWESSIVKNVQLVPEYNVTFNVKFDGSPLLNANVNFNGMNKLTSSDGSVVFSEVPLGYGYCDTVTLTGYHSFTSKIDVTTDKTINVNLVPESTTVYTVSFDVSHLSVPVPNATITFNETEQQTPSTGLLDFTNVTPGIGYSYTISKTGYQTSTGVIDVTADKTVNVDLTPISYSIVFSVKHLGIGVANANVNFNGSDLNTGSDGSVTFSNVPYGMGYLYSITKAGYKSVSGQTDVTTGKTIDVEFIPLFNVSFLVNNNSQPISNANVIFNNTTLQTSTDGTTFFSNVPYGLGYNYSVSKLGYQSTTGQIDVTENKTITIELSSNGIITLNGNKNLLKAWPNPFSNEVNFSIKLDKPSYLNLTVYSIDGRIVKNIANGFFNEGLNTFNRTSLTGLGDGSYIVVLRVNGKSYSQIIQHIR